VELLTSDVDAAQAFYSHVIGWTSDKSGLANRDYRVFSNDGHGAAGLLLLPEEAKAQDAPPHWLSYIAAEDVDADIEKILAAGGRVLRPAETLPGIGRFAVVSDPKGAPFALWKDLSGQNHPEFPPMSPGRVGWYELYTDDIETAFAFYAEKFGWTKGDALDMGPMGVYQLFATGGEVVGGMMRRPDAVPRPFWNTYFTVPSLDAAIERIGESGGRILNGPNQVPGGSWIVQALDPQGAVFSLVSAKR
jgi:predicted enzyme related to lactoylglutathione lyase